MGGEQGENSARGALTVTARVSNGSSRHAMPTLPELVYAALLYKDGEIPENPESKDFAQGTAAESGKLNFSFQKPEDTSGTFTLEIFAFVKTEGGEAPQFSKETALLSGGEGGLAIVGDAIVVTDPIALSSDKQGTVNLKIKVPDGCTLEFKEQKIDGTTESDPHFTVTGTSPNFVLTQKDESGISAGAYPVTFTVEKVNGEKKEIIHIFSEYINVINGLCTDTWSGSGKGAAKEITQSMISSTVYVRGTGEGWYANSDYKDTATASDTNSGSFLAPFATIQRAVDTIIARNDGTSVYTIYIDGTFTATSSAALANFNALSQTQKLSVKIVGLDASQKAILDGGGLASGIVVGASGAQKDVNLTLENLVIQNTQNSGRGGGITLYCTAGNSHMIKNCEITNNNAAYGSAIYNEYGSLDLQDCVITGNTTETSGTVYNGQASAILTMSDVRIENNSAGNGGGIFLGNNATVKISDASVVIKNNSASGNSRGPGISLWNGYLELSGSAKIDDIVGLYGGDIHEIVISGELTAESPVATITLADSAYAAGTKVLTAASGTTQGICDQFALSDENWKIVSDGTVGVLKAVINVYVRGSGEGWYTDNGHGDITGSDSNSGDRLHPFATIQKAVTAVKDLNDGETECTIYVDGTVTQQTSSSRVMVNLENLDKNLTLTIKSLSKTRRATLNANNFASVIEAMPSDIPLDLTIKNLILCNGNYGAFAVYVKGNDSGTFKFSMEGCEISGDKKGGIGIYNGVTFAIENCEIIGNNSGKNTLVVVSGHSLKGMILDSKIKGNAGACGLNVENTEITIKNCEISGNSSINSVGGIQVFDGGSGCSLTMEDCIVSDNTGTSGGGVSSNGTFIMKGNKSKISGNHATSSYFGGGGVYVKGGTFTMEGGEISGNDAAVAGGGVYVGVGSFIMNDGKITGNTAAEHGGGVYVGNSGNFEPNGGTLSGNFLSDGTLDDVYTAP